MPENVSGVVLPRNWEAVAAASGQDPQLVGMYKDAYGWRVGTEVVPPVEHREQRWMSGDRVAMGQTWVLLAVLLATFTATVRKPQPTTSTQKDCQ